MKECRTLDDWQRCALLLQEEVDRLRRALALAALPLEVLHATELDGTALCPEVKEGIREAVAAVREAVGWDQPSRPRA